MQLEALRIGSGDRPTLLVHGFLGSGRNLRSLARRWSSADEGRTFLLPDLTGHGSSGPLPPDADLGTLARDVLETARAEGFEGPFDWVGHSLGGRVGLAALRGAPEALSSLTLLDIAPGPIGARSASAGVLEVLRRAPRRAESREALRAVLLEGGLNRPTANWLLLNVAAEDGTDDGTVRWTFDREALAALHERVNDVDLWATLEGADLPRRCIRGAESGYVQDEDVRRLEAAGCRVVTLEGAGHQVHVEALAALVEALT